REKVNGRSHHTSRASRPKSGTAESVRSVVSRCHAVPNDLRQILDSRREETRASNMAMSHDRIDSSIPALVKRGFIGLMKIGEIDGLVIAWREVNVAPASECRRHFCIGRELRRRDPHVAYSG